MRKSIFLHLLPVIIFLSILVCNLSFDSSVIATSNGIVASKVQNINGQPAFVIKYSNGVTEVMDDILYDTYSYNQKNVENMAKNGTKTFSFVCTFADSADLWTKPVWLGKDASKKNIFDYSLIDEHVEMTLKVCPNARFIIRLYLGVPENWLSLAENADARAVTMKADGTKSYYYADNGITKADRYYYSISSQKAREQIGLALKKVITRIENKYPGKILGYNLTGLATEEFYRHGWHNTTYDDYSVAAEEEFKNFLRKKYISDTNLRTAWNNDTITFNSVSIPAASRRVAKTISGSNFIDTAADMDLIDFYRFYNESVPDFINSVAGYAKQAIPQKIIGVTYGYQFEFGCDPASGENALGKLSRASNIDFVKFEAGAVYRSSGFGGDNYRGPADSVMLNGKVTMLDNDSTTSLFRQTDAFINADPALITQYETNMPTSNALTTTPELSGAIQKRIIGFAGTNGFVPTFFDLHGGYYNESTIRTAMTEAENIYKAEMKYDRTSVAQILLVTDESSCEYLKLDNLNSGNRFLAEDTRRLIKNLMKSGMPYDAIVVDDLDKANLNQYKLIYFMNSYNATTTQRTLIDTCKGGGRTVVFAYAPGFFTNHVKSIDNMTSLVDMTMGTTAVGINQIYIPDNTDFGKILKEITGSASTTISTSRIVDRFTVNDANATIIGKTEIDGKANMAYKRFSTWTSMYIPFAGLSTDLLRAIGKFAGVHIYSERFDLEEYLKYDTVSASKNLIFIHANGSKTRTIYFPTKVDVYDPLTNVNLAKNVTSLRLTMDNGETKAIRIQATGNLFLYIVVASSLLLIGLIILLLLKHLKKKKTK